MNGETPGGADNNPPMSGPGDTGATVPPVSGDRPKSGKKSTGLLIGVIAGVIVLLAAIALVVVTVFGGINIFGESFEAGSCARQQGDGTAVAISCDDATDKDFTITKKVDDRAKCEDKTQPVIEIEGAKEFYCLAPYGSDTATEE